MYTYVQLYDYYMKFKYFIDKKSELYKVYVIKYIKNVMKWL